MYRIRKSDIIAVFIFVIYADLSVFSAENPLGIVTGVTGDQVIVAFDPSVYLHPGTMVGIYGGDTIKKHPLTDEVVVQQLTQVAKTQIIGEDRNLLVTRVTWKKSGVNIKIGMDAVPLLKEAAPNSPPIRTDVINEMSAPLQSSLRVSLPIIDLDDDEVFYIWKLNSEVGRNGFLEANSTRIPENTWFVPGIESKTEMTVIAEDAYGHRSEFSVNLSTLPMGSDWRARILKPFSAFGDNTSAHSLFLTRDQLGGWWSVTTEAIFSISPGWLTIKQILVNTPRTPLRPTAVAPHNQLLHLLDLNSPVVKTFGYDGTLKGSYGIISGGTDIAISNHGVAFIADQNLGGIQIYEPNGLYRACLGRAGEGNDYFSGLTRIALDRDGQLFALDRNANTVHRFSRFQERLPSWRLNFLGGETAVDLSWHPTGDLLLLLTGGRILRLDKQGKLIEPFVGSVKKLDFAYLGGPAESIYVDLSGEVYVTYPKDGVIVRYTTDGSLFGLRGSPFWGLSLFATDSKGHIYGFNANSKVMFELDSEGWVVQPIGAKGEKTARLETPSKLTVNPEGTVLTVLDSSKTNLTQFDLTGSHDPIVFGQFGRSKGQFIAPVDAIVDEVGNTYVLDSKLNRISVFDRNGYFLFDFGRKGKSTSELKRPMLLAITPDGKTAYIYDDYEIKKFMIDHQQKKVTHIGNAGGRGRRPGQLLKPVGIACDRQGLLYILDNGRKDLQVFDYRGSNAIIIFAKPFNDWGFEKVTAMSLNVDGRPYLIDSDKMLGLTWEK